MIIDNFITYIKTVRRYSNNTIRNYRNILMSYFSFFSEIGDMPNLEVNDIDVIIDNYFNKLLQVEYLRKYQVYIVDKLNFSKKTVNLHLSTISSFSSYLLKQGLIDVNPVKLIKRPKLQKRLPEFYKSDSMELYFRENEYKILEENLSLISNMNEEGVKAYKDRLSHLIISLLYYTGMRRSELIGLNKKDIDFQRHIIRVRGKGDKVREIPINSCLENEICLYLQSRGKFFLLDDNDKLLLNANKYPVYPVYVDKVVKEELSLVPDIIGRKSPHILRHTIATELLNNGADLNSIKSLLGHTSLAATQIYTHNSIESLKKQYSIAHPRPKKGGDYGDQS